MKYDFHTIVIGAGSAGLVTASIMASLGAKVALIEKNKMGGDCLNTGCVPSKSLLYHAKNQNVLSGIQGERTDSFNDVMKSVHQTIENISPHDSVERFESMGVTVLKGSAKLLDSHCVEVSLLESDNKDKKVISGKYIVIATGSKPRVPKLEGLEGIPYLTNKTLFTLGKRPKRFIIWGGGPISMEIGQAFSKLGSHVTIITRGHQLFKKDEPEVHKVMNKALGKDGVSFYFGYEPVKILQPDVSEDLKIPFIQLQIRNCDTGEEESLSGDQLLIALGRISSTENLGLKEAGVEVNQRGYVKVNQHLQTSQKNIYACGDVLGEYQFTHMAGYEAEIVAKNLVLPIKAKADYSKAAWTTYTNPQVAHSGYTEATADQEGKLGKVLLKSFENVDRSIIEGDTEGFVKIILDQKGIIIGGTVVSREAGEMIGMISLTIKKKMKIESFQSIIYSYPTKSEVFKALAAEHLKDSVQSWQKNLLKKWLERSINKER